MLFYFDKNADLLCYFVLYSVESGKINLTNTFNLSVSETTYQPEKNHRRGIAKYYYFVIAKKSESLVYRLTALRLTSDIF